ncbi:hypothetical protein V6N13_036354 [Hibiscus sabdariffa]
MITPMNHVADSRWKLHYSLVRTDANVLSNLVRTQGERTFHLVPGGVSNTFMQPDTSVACLLLSPHNLAVAPLGDTGRGGGENGETENPDEEDRKRSKQASNLLKAKKWTA